jgi:hypothetical protein
MGGSRGDSRKGWPASTAAFVVLAVALCATPSFAARGDCGQPVSDREAPTASDALYILRTAVGLQECPLQVCDVNSSGGINATDALTVLRRAVGLPVELNCRGSVTTTTRDGVTTSTLSDDTTTTSTTSGLSTTTTSTTTSTLTPSTTTTSTTTSTLPPASTTSTLTETSTTLPMGTTTTTVPPVAAHPYGVNNFAWPESTTGLFAAAGIDRYRLVIDWADFEPSDNDFLWTGERRDRLRQMLGQALANGARASVAIHLSPAWTRAVSTKVLSYEPTQFAEFVTALLEWAEENYPGAIASIEIENEKPTGAFSAEHGGPTFATDQRDPSWFYKDTLCTAAAAIRAFNDVNGTDILAVMHGMWTGAYHHLDELYQLGAGECFDRINFHYYLRELLPPDAGRPVDPTDPSTIWHFETTLAYLRHIAAEWGDAAKPIWLTEFGWRYPDNLEPGQEFEDFVPDEDEEQMKAVYAGSVLDSCRRSGLVEQTNLYIGTATPLDTMSMLYVALDFAPGGAEDHERTPLYETYEEAFAAFPTWQEGDATGIAPIPAASADAVIANADFAESVEGWSGFTYDGEVGHTAPGSGRLDANASETFGVAEASAIEPGVLYEVSFWLRIDATASDACAADFTLVQENGEGGSLGNWAPPNYLGLVDTRRYSNGWRRVRTRYVAAAEVASAALRVGLAANTACTLWIDEVAIRALDLSGEN